ncbi:hypothetical protein EYF80_047376 [Liparis tanakae]|uniref:Uncharacterized protein n=1 Tax=Liparis tanakae TaxID=230148 RepID=A0A4Z2FQ30_9TELE|nr:hypothetical protein EYF80_047376 [Liparis tanakae]
MESRSLAAGLNKMSQNQSACKSFDLRNDWLRDDSRTLIGDNVGGRDDVIRRSEINRTRFSLTLGVEVSLHQQEEQRQQKKKNSVPAGHKLERLKPEERMDLPGDHGAVRGDSRQTGESSVLQSDRRTPLALSVRRSRLYNGPNVTRRRMDHGLGEFQISGRGEEDSHSGEYFCNPVLTW